MLAMMPVQYKQGLQHSAGKNASAASAKPPKAKFLGNDAGYGDKDMGNNGNDATNANVPQLRSDWADASLGCWRQRGCNKGNNAIAMRLMMPVQQGQPQQ